MASKASFLGLIAVIVVVALLAEAPTSAKAAVACDIMQLLPCAQAILSDKVKPSDDCCTKLILQGSCLCQYKKKYPSYANSDGAKRVVKACKLNVSC
ncbi:hypothetical protein RND81_10G121000 [Saponaria officinalis]|uniref:Bifunctional inhibitor/plant lipid transfer protein/seed storage helical domain-containing protein n=1 Tax=Saponaria officinalis TaxID=3572 RepID=A0AAW1I3S6_SAPOF